MAVTEVVISQRIVLNSEACVIDASMWCTMCGTPIGPDGDLTPGSTEAAVMRHAMSHVQSQPH